MSKEVTTILKDDFDNSVPAAETLAYTYEGVSYTVDLSADNVKEFRDFMGAYVAVSTRVKTRGRPAAKPAPRKRARTS